PPTGLNNLLTNAGFGVWSNSDAIFIASDGMGQSGVSADISGTSLTVTGSGATQAGTSPGWIVGDHIGLWVNSSVSWVGTAPSGNSIYEIVTRTDGLNYVLDRAITGLTLPPTGSSGVTNVHLVVPGVTAASDDNMDGWHRPSATLDLFRAPISGVSKEGSLYSVYVIKGDNTAENFFWPKTIFDKIEHYKRYLGRTVTIGLYVKTWASSNSRITIVRGSGSSASDYHPGDGEWRWLEVTRAHTAGDNELRIAFNFDKDSGDTAYVTRPCLAYGSFIGEGNCLNQIGEVIRFETDVIAINYNFGAGGVLIDVDASLNIEVESELKIPKGISEIYTTLKAIDSAPADNIGVWMGPDSNYTAQDIGDVGLFLNTNVVADKPSTNNGWVRTVIGGHDPWLFLNGSGAATLDLE
ncbi:hypothetical protein LCGC14_2803430, partial [marine sediment metagenome]